MCFIVRPPRYNRRTTLSPIGKSCFFLRGVVVSKAKPVVCESLEHRLLMAAAEPTPMEVYFVTLINRARMNPAGEALRYGITLNEGLPRNTISRSPLPPVAISNTLTHAARGHSTQMLAVDQLEHEGIGDGSILDRLILSGYYPIYPAAVAENIGWYGASSGWPDPQATVDRLHHDLFVDTAVSDRIHRIILMNPDMTEVGVGYVAGTFRSGMTNWNSMMVTQDFAYTSGNRFITGVAYSDTVQRNKDYTPGEGLGSVKIEAQRLSDGKVFSITTGQAGAYSLAVPLGTYRVTASGGGLPKAIVRDEVVIAGSNALADFRIRPASAPSLSDAGGLHVDGTAGNDLISLSISGGQLLVKVNASTWTFPADQVISTEIWGWQGNDTILGSAISDVIYGMWDNDAISGGAGSDFVSGGTGNDTIGGGGGSDTLYGNAGTDMISGGGGDDVIWGGGGRDKIDGGLGDNSSDYNPLETRTNIQHLLV